MALIKSISGIRGTIGGKVSDNLTPIDIVSFAAAYGTCIQQKNNSKKIKIVVGRDARISGPMVQQLIVQTLVGLGIDVIDAGLATTPTVEMAVVFSNADGGIIITASHNPKQWNALKLLNEKGEFISDIEGKAMIQIAEKNDFTFAEIDDLGKVEVGDYLQAHIDAILNLPLVNVAAIKNANFSIVVDAVNSVGGIAVPALLQQLGVQVIHKINCEPTGIFAHNPEPIPEHLNEICNEVLQHKANLGIVVDPDVDRLALVCEDGTLFGEEYTLVAIADYYLNHKKGNTVSNLSSSYALRDVTLKLNGMYYASAVGEVNVVARMKEVSAIIGGEGNGGIIVPELHYGRDALAGIALFLSHLATCGKSASRLRYSYPAYFMSKGKVELHPATDVDQLLDKIKQKYEMYPLNLTDGIKIEMENEWIHIRRSNTEPIVRIYSESNVQSTADNLVNKIKNDIKELLSL